MNCVPKKREREGEGILQLLLFHGASLLHRSITLTKTRRRRLFLSLSRSKENFSMKKIREKSALPANKLGRLLEEDEERGRRSSRYDSNERLPESNEP